MTGGVSYSFALVYGGAVLIGLAVYLYMSEFLQKRALLRKAFRHDATAINTKPSSLHVMIRGKFALIDKRLKKFQTDFELVQEFYGLPYFKLGIASAFLIVAAIAFALSNSIIASTGIGVIGSIGALYLYVEFFLGKHAHAILTALPQAVDGLIRCLKAGFDLNRSLTIVSDEVSPELQREFRVLIRHRDFGQSLGDAIYQMAERLQNQEALFLATLIAVQERSGGPLIDALTSLSQILKDRERLRQKRQVASSESRMSAMILGGLPVLIAALLFATNPSYRDILLNTQSGRIALSLAIVLLCAGIIAMYRMIRIESK